MKLLKTALLVFLSALSTQSFAADLTPLMNATLDGNKKAVERILKQKTDINAQEKSEKRTALYFAISNEQKEITKILIEKGANLKNLSEGQESALFLATTTNNQDLMKQLLKKDKTLLDLPDNEGTTPLMEAAKYGTKQTIEILIKAGAKKDQKNKRGVTAQEIAKENKNEEALQLLTEEKK